MIVCECGHVVENHNAHGCTWWVEHKDINKKLPCQCTLSPNIIEARYWARKMMIERDRLQAENNAINKKLKSVVALLRYMGLNDETESMLSNLEV